MQSLLPLPPVVDLTFLVSLVVALAGLTALLAVGALVLLLGE